MLFYRPLRACMMERAPVWDDRLEKTEKIAHGNCLPGGASRMLHADITPPPKQAASSLRDERCGSSLEEPSAGDGRCVTAVGG